MRATGGIRRFDLPALVSLGICVRATRGIGAFDLQALVP